ncbi:cysteine hydrolase family protein [Halobacillus litoralis]|uniref:cysteine hydrolase family protein n=1 Tax=Halobacillus litoralis TaxID=45668 RepID=UPI001CD769F1|nr:isochorismatase family cysteine hydrolase [Halobacillus litoralis]MCA1024086.1 cysteine hydrolase [Halobacillus litoralis]
MEASTALLIIDMMNTLDFDGGEDLLENALPAAEDLQSFKQKMKEQGMPVIYVNDNFGLWQDNTSDIIDVCRKSPGEPLVELTAPDEDDFFIIKPKHSGFFGTQLEILLNQLGVSRLILSGVAGDICVLFTANDAYMREYELWVPSNLSASESRGDNDNAMKIIRRSLGAETAPTSEKTLEDVFPVDKRP